MKGWLLFSPRSLGSVLLSLLTVSLMSGCYSFVDKSDTERISISDRPISIIATVGMVGSLVEMVGGDRVQVNLLCGPGVDPHLYKATRDDVMLLLRADMVFSSGLKLEGKLADALRRITTLKPVLAVAESIKSSSYLTEQAEGSTGEINLDPHIWMDASLWSQGLDAIAQQLSEIDPLHAHDYLTRAELARDELGKLHEYGLQIMKTVPEESRVLITSHDAFGYFGRAYGLEVQGVQGLSTESEGGLQQINYLVDLIVERRIQSVFVESSVSSKSIDALVEGAKARGHSVQVGSKKLFSDAMGHRGTYEGTYVGMLDHNLTTVARDLGGTAPERGFQGKLQP